MSEPEVKDKVITIITSELGSNVGIFLFGSRSQNMNKTFSDFDIGIIDSMPIERHKIAKIREALEESTIPYKIDLVDFHSVSPTFKAIALESIQIWVNPEMVKSLFKSAKS
jgi:predicted nucleotidyltransferase